jgi:hypothetical protein
MLDQGRHPRAGSYRGQSSPLALAIIATRVGSVLIRCGFNFTRIYTC